MANINGTNKSDHIEGTSGDDVIYGNRGSDWIEGNGGVDHLFGGEHRDTFVIRASDGDGATIIVEDFQWNDTDPQGGYDPDDRVLTDFGGSYSDILFLGEIVDGGTFTTFNGGATYTFDFTDYNSDGVEDLVTTVTQNSTGIEGIIVLLGIGQDDNATGAIFAGG